MKIQSVFDKSFAPYGKVIKGFDTAALEAEMLKMPCPDGAVVSPAPASLGPVWGRRVPGWPVCNLPLRARRPRWTPPPAPSRAPICWRPRRSPASRAAAAQPAARPGVLRERSFLRGCNRPRLAARPSGILATRGPLTGGGHLLRTRGSSTRPGSADLRRGTYLHGSNRPAQCGR